MPSVSRFWSGRSLYVRSLELTNFRNFRRATVELHEGPVVLVGDNGQGKTNLLEATELLAMAKSPRAGSDRELINWSGLTADTGPLAEQFARVRATVLRESRDLRAEILIREVGGGEEGEASSVVKTFKINGLAKRALEFVGTINAVSFSPLDLALVDGPPAGRRRYLDVMNAQVSPKYLYTLQRYQKVLFQRNHLLRQLRARQTDDASLSVWTEQLVSEGAYLIVERTRSIARLSPLADRWFHELAGDGDHLQILYQPSLSSLGESEPTDPEDLALEHIRDVFAAELDRMRPRERGAGMSLVGPHRDDLHFVLDGVDLNVYGSRGQQRLGALALKLAEADHLEERASSRPVLLMDDVLSELDRKRQLAVMRFVAQGGQTLLTTTALEVIDKNALPNALVLNVAGGLVGG